MTVFLNYDKIFHVSVMIVLLWGINSGLAFHASYIWGQVLGHSTSGHGTYMAGMVNFIALLK